MTNFQVYKKTLSFSFLMFAVGLLGMAIVAGCSTAGFFIADNTPSSRALIGLAIGFVVGIIIYAFIDFFVTNRIRAAQIGMMTIGVTDGNLPDNTFKEGFAQVKGRFLKLSAFFFITNAIKGIFQQIGRSINRFGAAVGGQVGDTVTSVIDSAIQTLIAYLCDCCLGWVMYHKDESMARCACEGAVIFFKHGKTLIRNIGRLFGMGLLSFVVVGGAFFGIGYLVLSQFPNMFVSLSNEIIIAAQGSEVPEAFTNPTYLTLMVCTVIAILLWSMVHTVVGHPFILVGVLRNFMAAGLKDRPTEQDFAILDSKSPRFAKLHKSI